MVNLTTNTRYCPNAYSERVFLTDEQMLLFKFVFISLAPVAVIANGIIIYRITRSKLYRNVSNFLILIMSIADFLTGAATLPCVYALYSTYARSRFCVFELATQFVSTTLGYISIAMVMFIAIERLITQKFKSVSGVVLSNRSARCLALATITVSISMCSLLTISSTYNSIRIISMAFSLIIIIIVTVVFASYVLTYIQIYNFVRNSIVCKGNSFQRRATLQKFPTYLHELGKTALYIILGMAFCYLPVVILIFIAFFNNTSEDCLMTCNVDKSWLRIAFYVAYALIYSNSSLNALIILIRNRSIGRCEQKSRRPNAVAPEKAIRRCYAISET